MTVYEVHVSLKYADAAEISLPSLYAGASEMPVKARAQVALASVSDGAKGDPGPKGSDGQMIVATSATAAATAAKVATLRSGTLSLKAGASVTVVFSEANTAASPTLNVGGTGAKAIRTNGTPYAYWVAGTAVSFVYDGTYWQVCSVPVYASTVTVGNPGGPNVYIDSDSVDVRKAATVFASFGPELVELGKNSESATIRMLAGLATIVARKFGAVSGIEMSANGIGLQATSGNMNIHSHFPSTGRGGVGQVDVSTELVSGEPMLGVWVADTTDAAEDGVSIGVTPFGVTTNHPEYLRSAIGVETVAGALAAGDSVADLDTCGTGVFSYNVSTAHAPTSYGTCVSLSAASGSWLFQLALPTGGEPHWRRNINGAGWSAWWQWATS